METPDFIGWLRSEHTMGREAWLAAGEKSGFVAHLDNDWVSSVRRVAHGLAQREDAVIFDGVKTHGGTGIEAFNY